MKQTNASKEITLTTSKKVGHAEEQQTNSFSKDAAGRTLLRIKNKLQGVEDPTGEPLGVKGQVDFLINEAKNPLNLCKLFPGWAPWL
jgi:ataxia telangiectasia mutated family protein